MDISDQFGNETIYIGKNGIEEDGELVVVDWRTEMGQLYNSYHGSVSQFQIGGSHDPKVQVLKKRAITIENDRVTRINDIGESEVKENELGETVKYMDEYLEEILHQTGEEHQLRDIISSIQQEQDEIIRLPLKNLIIIQGAAGSGKSTIALHRISYLLFKYQERLTAEKVLILAPNEMFLSYIKQVVPELDLNEVEQRTFYDWASHYFTDVRNISELHDDYVKIYAEANTEELIQVSKYKGSLQFKKLLDEMVSYIGETMIPHGDIVIDAETILSKSEIDSFYNSKLNLPLNIRMREMKSFIQNWSKQQLKQQHQRIENQFEDAYDKWVVTLPEGNERKKMYEALENAKALRMNQYRMKLTNEIDSYVRKMEEIPAIKMYKSVFQKRVFNTFDIGMEESLLSLLLKNGRKVKKSEFSYEDIAPLIYLDAKINGKKLEYDHLVIDEAQDYSPFQLAIMKDYAKSMTILGDMAQGIFSFYGLDSWDEVGSYVFNDTEIQQLNLQTSYRSTKQIMDLANRVLINSSYDFPLVIPVNRQGDEPKLKQIESSRDLYDNIFETIKQCIEKSHNKIAIITNSRETAVDLYDGLTSRGLHSIDLITEGNQELSSKVVIIPAFLVKGLEFDAVIIEDVSEKTFRDETLHAKLLYMAITRAHHELHMFYRENYPHYLKFEILMHRLNPGHLLLNGSLQQFQILM